MFRLAIRTIALFLAVGPIAMECFAQVSFDLTPQEESVCKKELKIVERGHNSEGFSWACSQAMLDKQRSEFVALRRSMHGRSAHDANAFRALLTAFQSFHAKERDYLNRSCYGTVCAIYSALDEVRYNRDFLDVTEKIQDGVLPIYNKADLSAADDSLNKKFQYVLKAVACPEVMIGEARPCDEDLRVVERSWIRYREAWATSGSVLWPQVDQVSLKTFLTNQRTQELSR